MLRHDLTNCILEEERRFLVLRMQLAVDEDAPVEILLLVVAEHFVFSHHARVHVTDEFKVFVGGVLVAVDFVGHGGVSGALGEELLDHDEVWSVSVR